MLRTQHSTPTGPGSLVCVSWLLAAFALLPVLLTPGSAQAEPLDLEIRNFSAELAPYVRYLEDVQKHIGPQEAYERDLERDFKPITGNQIDFGFTRARFWLRASVRNASEQAGTWKLALDIPYVEEIAVYIVKPSDPNAQHPQLLMSVSDNDAFAARGENHRNFVVDLDLAPREQADLLIAYSSKQATQLPVFIEAPERFYSRVRVEDIHNWALFALLVGMTLMSTVFVSALGYNTALYYGVYILLSGLYLFHTDGYAFQYLWPKWPWWNQVAVAPIGLALVAGGSLFARAFVDAPRFHPWLNRAIISVAITSITLLVLSFWLLQFDWFKTGALLFVFLCAALQLLAGVLAIRRGHAGARLFLCGALAVISSVVFGLVGYLNPGQFNQDIAAHSARYALLFEGAAFALAAFLNAQTLRREHNAAMRREIEIGGEKLALSEALRTAEGDYHKAIELAAARQAQLASTAHDIKQPLTSLRLALMRMNSADADAAVQINNSFDYLDSLVQANLENSGVGEAEPDTEDSAATAFGSHESFEEKFDAPERFAVSVVLDNVAAMFKDEARSIGVELKLVPSSATIVARPVQLMRMVGNLVSNAVKHAGQGTVLIGCRRSEQGLRVEVHDNGPGLSEEELGRVLQPYNRGAASKGTGLGLTVVSELAAHNGMDFSLSSVEGRGTVATITIPQVDCLSAAGHGR